MIDSEHKLAAFLPALCAASWVAMDTEADSLHAYPEKLCLIQISIEGRDELIDPLAGLDLGPLWAALAHREILMHGADYDLRLLHRCARFVPTAVFDTMLAARLLGFKRFGLTDLVARCVGVTLEKGPQKANWARRPLTPRMAAYARNDSHYLKPVADLLRFQLAEKGRLDWHRESCARLIEESTQIRPPDPDQVWRVKGSAKLDPHGLAVLREIWHWRETEALAANKPPFFILAPDVMVQLAQLAVAAPEAVPAALPRYFSPRRQHGLLEAIARGRQARLLPEVPQPRGRRHTEAEKRRLQELLARRNRQAARLGMDPTLIASRTQLALLARDWAAHQAELMAWQRALLSSQVPQAATTGPG